MRESRTIRLVNWNLNWKASRAEREGQIDLVRELAPDLLTVQEVSAGILRPFEELFDWSVFALGENPDDPRWSSRIGTAVLGRGLELELLGQMSVAPTWFELDHDTRWKANRFSRRATWARVGIGGSEPAFLVGSLHASPAAGDVGEHKPWFHAGLGRWLARTDEPWIFGIDANTPATDAPDPVDTRWCWPRTDAHPGEDELLGNLARHAGRDLLRDWLDGRPDELERIRAERPNGPLATSYRLRTGPVRYDHCWATPEFSVHSIEYLQRSLEFSDHTAIVAEVTFDPHMPAPTLGVRDGGDVGDVGTARAAVVA